MYILLGIVLLVILLLILKKYTYIFEPYLVRRRNRLYKMCRKSSRMDKRQYYPECREINSVLLEQKYN